MTDLKKIKQASNQGICHSADVMLKLLRVIEVQKECLELLMNDGVWHRTTIQDAVGEALADAEKILKE